MAMVNALVYVVLKILHDLVFVQKPLQITALIIKFSKSAQGEIAFFKCNCRNS